MLFAPIGLLRSDLEQARSDLEQARTDIALNTLRAIVEGGFSYLNMTDGVADDFTDETGVNGAGVVGFIYDGALNRYVSGVYDQISTAGGTPIGNMFGNGALSNAFDGNTNQAATACAASSGSPNPVRVGLDFGVGNEQRPTRIVVYSSNNKGFNYSSGGTDEYIAKVRWSDNGADWTDEGDPQTFNNSNSLIVLTFDIDPAADHRYWDVHFVPVSGSNTCVAEIVFFEASGGVAALPSIAFDAEAQPSRGRLVGLLDVVNDPDPGTDFDIGMSRDNGETWTDGLLTDRGAFTGTVHIVTADIDLSAQNSGTSMRWRVTASGVVVPVHSIFAQWGV